MGNIIQARDIPSAEPAQLHIDVPARFSRRASRLLALYLALTLIPALLAARAGGVDTWRIAAAHAAGLCWIAVELQRGPPARQSAARRIIVELAPLIALPFLYFELPALIAGFGAPYRDAIVEHWELALFGGSSPARELASFVVRGIGLDGATAVSALLHASYLSYYAIIYVPPLILLARGERQLFSRTLTGLMVAFLLCYLVFVVAPVQGPRYVWPAPIDVPDEPVRRLTLRLLTAGSSRGTAFPSSHVAVAVAQSIMALAWQRRVGVLLSIDTVLLAIATVFGGFHYAIDVIVGGGLGVVIGVLMIARTARPLAR